MHEQPDGGSERAAELLELPDAAIRARSREVAPQHTGEHGPTGTPAGGLLGGRDKRHVTVSAGAYLLIESWMKTTDHNKYNMRITVPDMRFYTTSPLKNQENELRLYNC